METAPTSIEVLLRPTLGQSDEPSDLRGFLSPTSVYSTWQSPGGHPSNYEPGALLNFSDRANHDERTPYSVYIGNIGLWDSPFIILEKYGVKQQTTSVTIYGDKGRYPLFLKQQIIAFKYWIRLISLPRSCYLRICTHWRLLTLLVKQIGALTSGHYYSEQNIATFGKII